MSAFYEYLIPDDSIRRCLAEELRLMENHYRWERSLRRRKLATRVIPLLIAAILSLAVLATLGHQLWLLV